MPTSIYTDRIVRKLSLPRHFLTAIELSFTSALTLSLVRDYANRESPVSAYSSRKSKLGERRSER